jgi:hypothetical protein
MYMRYSVVGLDAQVMDTRRSGECRCLGAAADLKRVFSPGVILLASLEGRLSARSAMKHHEPPNNGREAMTGDQSASRRLREYPGSVGEL